MISFRRTFAYSTLAGVASTALIAITGAGVAGVYAISIACLAVVLLFLFRHELSWWPGGRRDERRQATR